MNTMIIFEDNYYTVAFKSVKDLRKCLIKLQYEKNSIEDAISERSYEAEKVSEDIYLVEIYMNQGYGRYAPVYRYYRVYEETEPQEFFEVKVLGEYDYRLSAEETKEFNQ